MTIEPIEEVIPLLDKNEKAILTLFANNLIKKRKLLKNRTEIEKRREEIKQGKTLSHQDIWDEL
ncbi:MAG TPA: hypothetical protein DHW82_05505 [Spirochaetia bacterium]|nr:MAG: hypothetical protein A2Y41_07460 [Spirochaetes bacterium GWB1_36_13]HCL56449.1 hypothetical protein [Spirochaetia bacterium]